MKVIIRKTLSIFRKKFHYQGNNSKILLEDIKVRGGYKFVSQQDHKDQDQLYNDLKEAIGSEGNAQERYIATKILYQKFPGKSLPFITQRLMNDNNYHLQIINFSERKRYNVNDLLNTMITNKYDKEHMIYQIIENNLISFLLSWKECAPFSKICYDLHLKCFLMREPTEKLYIYVCSRRKDPFSDIPILTTVSLAQNSQLLEIPKIKVTIKKLIILFEQVFGIKKPLLLLNKLNTSLNTELPCYKMAAQNHEIVIYF